MKRMVLAVVVAWLACMSQAQGGEKIMVPLKSGGFRGTTIEQEEATALRRLEQAKTLLAGGEVINMTLPRFAWLWRERESPVLRHTLVWSKLSGKARAAVDETEKLLADVQGEPPPAHPDPRQRQQKPRQ